MKKVLVIVGPTASGKTSFAIRMAEYMHTEIISGDSIQVYQGLNIGSGKVTEEEKKGIRHYLIDILSPFDSYNVKDFQRQARALMDSHDQPMIICGGTGMYLKAALYDYRFDEEKKDLSDPEWDSLSNEELYDLLRKTDPKQAEKIHPNNRRRIERALAIYRNTGKRMSENIDSQNHEMIYDAFIAGLTMERKILYERINARVEGMFKHGLEEEVSGLLKKGVTFENACMQGIGYKEWKAYFEGNMSEEEVKENIQKHSRQFAKRQYTWLNHQMPVHWFCPLIPEETEQMITEIRQWLDRSDIIMEKHEGGTR